MSNPERPTEQPGVESALGWSVATYLRRKWLQNWRIQPASWSGGLNHGLRLVPSFQRPVHEVLVGYHPTIHVIGEKSHRSLHFDWETIMSQQHALEDLGDQVDSLLGTVTTADPGRTEANTVAYELVTAIMRAGAQRGVHVEAGPAIDEGSLDEAALAPYRHHFGEPVLHDRVFDWLILSSGGVGPICAMDPDHTLMLAHTGQAFPLLELAGDAPLVAEKILSSAGVTSEGPERPVDGMTELARRFPPSAAKIISSKLVDHPIHGPRHVLTTALRQALGSELGFPVPPDALAIAGPTIAEVIGDQTTGDPTELEKPAVRAVVLVAWRSDDKITRVVVAADDASADAWATALAGTGDMFCILVEDRSQLHRLWAFRPFS